MGRLEYLEFCIGGFHQGHKRLRMWEKEEQTYCSFEPRLEAGDIAMAVIAILPNGRIL